MSNPESNTPVVDETAEVAASQTAGSLITSARESAGLTVEELAGRMCMTPSKLQYLEQDDYERLAGATYVRGYLRNTCKELGIDPTPVLAAFERQLPAQMKAAIPQEPRGPVIGGAGSSGGGLFRSMLLVAIVAAAGGYWWFNQGSMPYVKSQVAAVAPQAEVATVQVEEAAASEADEWPAAESVVAEQQSLSQAVQGSEDDALASSEALQAGTQLETAAAPESAVAEEFSPNATGSVTDSSVVAAEPEAAVEPEVAPVVADNNAEAPAADASGYAEAAVESNGNLAISFSEDSWVEVTDASGKKLLAKLQPAGSSVELEGEAPFSLMLGNAAGTTVSYQGEVVDSAPLGNRRTRKLTVGG